MNALKEKLAPANVKKAVGVIRDVSKTLRFRIRTYRPNTNFCEDNSRFIIKIIENGEELMEVLRLRYQVFYGEYAYKTDLYGIDVDKFDTFFDHLAIIDKKSGRPVGTYRLNSTRFNKKFYSEKEFHMDEIKELSGHKIELGRACVHPDYRNGATIAALWKGLGAYMSITDSRYMFGCSSIHSDDTFQTALIHHWLGNSGYLPKEYDGISPRGKFRDKKFDRMIEKTGEERFAPFRDAAVNLIPPLLLSYLKAGGFVCGKPAYDKAFKCYDYLTLIDRKKMDPAFVRKFLK
ncbi:MAG: GNAT family N-acetyltransferase [Deferribacterales bacterium]